MRYLGSKSRTARAGLVKVINSLAAQVDSYWEPFCGACRVMQSVRCRARYGSDTNPHIICLLKAVQQGWNPPETLTYEEHAEWKRKAKAGLVHPMTGFAGHGCSFGGDFFCGWVKYNGGRRSHQNPALETRLSLLQQKPMLAGVELKVRDYRGGFWGPGVPGLVYCDPPYDGTSSVGDRGEKFDSGEFWEWVRETSAETTVLVSEYACPVKGAAVVWSRTLAQQLRTKDGRGVRTENLYCLNPKVRSRIGFGLPIS